MKEIVRIENLEAGYGKHKEVFRGLSLSLHGGHIYGLLGKNGAGKSTLLRLMYGLLFPEKGRINVLGYTPKKRLPGFLQQVFMVPEDLYLPDITIPELIRYHSSFYPKFDKNLFDNYLELFEVPVKNRLMGMSYGQKKKVLISLGLATRAPLLLMDEPTNGLDIMSKSQFRKLVSGILDPDTSIIISTHQVKDLENLIDRVMIIDEARILFDRTLPEISNRLSFAILEEGSAPGNALYAEAGIGGTQVVMPNITGEDSRVDLELLYKAVVQNVAEMKNIFETEKEKAI
jgi:ABC-2 type transport system ATP-binding protein